MFTLASERAGGQLGLMFCQGVSPSAYFLGTYLWFVPLISVKHKHFVLLQLPCVQLFLLALSADVTFNAHTLTHATQGLWAVRHLHDRLCWVWCWERPWLVHPHLSGAAGVVRVSVMASE